MRHSLRAVASLILVVVLVLPAIANPDFPPVKFVTVRSPVPHGGQALVTIQTRPATYCAIAVIYKSGSSKAAGLDPQTSDAGGKITWTWKVGTRTTPGTWPIIVECGRNDITRVRTTFEVT